MKCAFNMNTRSYNPRTPAQAHEAPVQLFHSWFHICPVVCSVNMEYYHSVAPCFYLYVGAAQLFFEIHRRVEAIFAVYIHARQVNFLPLPRNFCSSRWSPSLLEEIGLDLREVGSQFPAALLVSGAAPALLFFGSGPRASIGLKRRRIRP